MDADASSSLLVETLRVREAGVIRCHRQMALRSRNENHTSLQRHTGANLGVLGVLGTLGALGKPRKDKCKQISWTRCQMSSAEKIEKNSKSV